jgi:Helix-turn-helix domain of resolvase
VRRLAEFNPDGRRSSAVERFKAGETVMEIAGAFGVDRATIYRLAEASACGGSGLGV